MVNFECVTARSSAPDANNLVPAPVQDLQVCRPVCSATAAAHAPASLHLSTFLLTKQAPSTKCTCLRLSVSNTGGPGSGLTHKLRDITGNTLLSLSLAAILAIQQPSPARGHLNFDAMPPPRARTAATSSEQLACNMLQVGNNKGSHCDSGHQSALNTTMKNKKVLK